MATLAKPRYFDDSASGPSRRNVELMLLIFAAIPVLWIYSTYIINTGTALSVESLLVPILLVVAFAAAHVAIRFLAPGADPAILPIVFVLSGIGITFVTRLVPSYALAQVRWLFVAIAAMVVVLLLVRNLESLAKYKYTIGAIAVVLILLPMIFGTEIYGSKLWLKLGPFTFQPGEIAKVAIVLFLAAFFAENRELLSASERHFGPISVPKFRMLLPVFIMGGLSLLIVIFERDLGSALLFFTIFITMLYVVTGRISYVLVALILLAIGAYGCYHLFSHVKVRFDIWLDPFQDAQNKGMQIVQSLYSLADGSLFGTGLGKGLPTLIPVVESDFIFSAIGEEMGLLGGSAVLLLFMLFAVRGFATAARAKSDLAAFTAVGLTTAISFQAFLIVGGVIKFLPLTGVTLPFMSQGGSSLLSSFIIVALLLRCGDEGTGHSVEMQGSGVTKEVSSNHLKHAHAAKVKRGAAFLSYGMETPESGVMGRVALSKRLIVLVTFFAVLFAALIGNLTYIQIIKANEYKSMPSNNHTIIRTSKVQRGAIITADGTTLAESEKQDDGTYTRTYPNGNMAEHTVGYVSQRFGAVGVESSQNDTLTGHADHSTWDSTIKSLAGIEQPGNNVALSIDSRIQAACEKALTSYTGGIVVMNPQTGAILAKASSPTYDVDDIAKSIENDSGEGELIDRTTQALYSPGSTFKLVTLSGALESGKVTLDSVFDGSAKITIGNADVTNIHGEEYDKINIKSALAHSVNTVFAQVANELGAEDLVRFARSFGYTVDVCQDFSCKKSVMPDPTEMTEWETAWAGCGQPVGEHKSPAGPQTTIMQNAMMCAGIANNGITMNPFVVDHILSPEGVQLSETAPKVLNQSISADTAAKVKEAMLECATSGTGVASSVSGVSIGCKTGTAETGSSINSLYVGFAPFDKPTMVISICIEGGKGRDVAGVAAQLASSIIATTLDVQASGAE